MKNSGHKLSRLCLHNLRYQLIPSRDIDHEKILKNDKGRGTPGHRQPNVVVTDATLPWWISPCKETKISIKIFLKN